MSSQKLEHRNKIRMRIRKKVNGTPERPRLSVFRSNVHIYAQIIDDTTGRTLAAASSKEEGIAEKKVNKVEQSKMVGNLVASKAKAAGIELVVFDRGGNLYHGRVKSLADGAREGGLQF